MLAIEQAVSQGRFDVARGLVPVVHDNRQHDEAVSERRRRTDVANDD
ncbi:hypothetical protein [Oceanibacterium hippocampi]|nr:hypothetical protein [Oceanibacterium hippocampi]